MRMIARKKMNIAMKITPHLIGKHPKHEASPTLSWLHAQRQQQHGLKLYLSGSEASDGTYGFSANGFNASVFGIGGIRFCFSSSLFGSATSMPISAFSIAAGYSLESIVFL